jgi:hypothetical protein
MHKVQTHLRSTPVRILSKALIIAQLNNLLVHNDSSHADVARAYATSTNTQLKCVHTHIDNSLALYAHADLVKGLYRKHKTIPRVHAHIDNSLALYAHADLVKDLYRKH